MAITYTPSTRTFRLDSDHASYAFSVIGGGILLHRHFGGKISDDDLEYLNTNFAHASFSAQNGQAGLSLDTALLEYPCSGTGDFRESALQICSAQGHIATDIRYTAHRIYDGKPALPGLPATYADSTQAQTLEVDTLDAVTGAKVTLFYTVFPQYDAFCRHVRVENTGKETFQLEKVCSGSVDFPEMEYDLVHLYGTWAKERTVERTPLLHGVQGISSRRGSSSHQHNPFMALAAKNADEEQGEVFGFSLVYSSNFCMHCETDAFGTARVTAGIDPDTFSWTLLPGEVFTTPELVMVYSDEGLGGMSRRFHKLYRFQLCRGPWKTRERPILINNWEATYFDFTADKLVDIARTAKELGVEMLVMDDGWFGRRNDDHSSLGDWFVNEEKLGCTLGELVQRVNELGLQFGIWFEPEMVSPVSRLYEQHPDWVIGVPGRTGSLGRSQLVLDLSRSDVQDYLFTCMADILHSANISYIKWDFNRNITEAGSALLPPQRQKEFFHRYTLGLYALLERLLQAFPNLLLEGCSGGGGRFDPAMLYYSPQIWTSDDTDAMERLSIQLGTSMVYPASSMSAHVSACPNHQTGRTVSFGTRGVVAMAGAFGYELDLTSLTDEEKQQVRRQVQTYHQDFDTIQNGDLYRLLTPANSAKLTAWQYVSADRSKTVVTVAVGMNLRSVALQKRLRLQGLDADAVYVDADTGREYHGDTLLHAGLNLTGNYTDFTAFAVHLYKK